MFQLEKATKTISVTFHNDNWADLNIVRGRGNRKDPRHCLIAKIKNLYKIAISANATFCYFSVHSGSSLLQLSSAPESNLVSNEVEELSTESR